METFKGKGDMVAFVKTWNTVITAFANTKVSQNYVVGNPAALTLTPGKLTLSFRE